MSRKHSKEPRRRTRRMSPWKFDAHRDNSGETRSLSTGPERSPENWWGARRFARGLTKPGGRAECGAREIGVTKLEGCIDAGGRCGRVAAAVFRVGKFHVKGKEKKRERKGNRDIRLFFFSCFSYRGAVGLSKTKQACVHQENPDEQRGLGAGSLLRAGWRLLLVEVSWILD